MTEQNEKEAMANLRNKILLRKPSLSEAEEIFLHALLIDGENSGGSHDRWTEAATVLDDDMLFMIPDAIAEKKESKQEEDLNNNKKVPKPAKRRSIGALWASYQDGVDPKKLASKSSFTLNFDQPGLAQLQKSPNTSNNKKELLLQVSSISQQEETDLLFPDIPSDDEVRPDGKDDHSDDSSWDEEENFDFNAWDVLKDEYSQDFGYDYQLSTRSLTVGRRISGSADEEEDADDHGSTPNHFLILGTSADDKAAQPHVLSPPLMDALAKFLPEIIQGTNYWLKFSLVRDGANLETLKRYCRASKYTILAIETSKGEVFGSFTSQPWQANYGFYGSNPAFVWKMTFSRRTKCYSLFDQAHLESQIDVFRYNSPGSLVQVCRTDQLAVGGDESVSADGDIPPCASDISCASSLNDGFAIALSDDLLSGTTSPCGTFTSPALCGKGDKTEVFQVAGLEVWAFTPCRDLDSAEKLEMTQFFIAQSSRNSSLRGSPDSSIRGSTNFTREDLIQEHFFRRAGFDTESQLRRDQWSYRNMMDGTGTGRGIAGGLSSPRFGH